MKHIGIVLSLCLLLTGCFTPSIPTGTSIKPESLNDSGVVIVGMNSALPGTWSKWSYSDGKVNAIFGSLFFSAVNSTPPANNGFVVMKVSSTSAGTRFGPATFGNGSRYFKYCRRMMLPTVEVKPGEVLYVGDINATQTGSLLKVQYGYDYEKAEQFVRTHHPELIDKLQGRRFILYPISSLPAC